MNNSNLTGVQVARYNELKNKAASAGLTDSEKEELRDIEEESRRVK